MMYGNRDIKETMPQTVPSASYSPPPPPPSYSTFTEDFDLSLLQEGQEVPSPSNTQVPMYDSSTSPIRMFPSPPHDGSTVYDLKLTMMFPMEVEEPCTEPTPSPPPPPSYSSAVPVPRIKSEYNPINLEELLQEHEMLRVKVAQEYPSSPLVPSPQQQVPDLTCFSPQQTYLHTPPISPNSDIISPKQEPSSSPIPNSPQEYHVLRQCLRDTTFQTKYNLKPFDFGIATGFAPVVKQEAVEQEDDEEQLTKEKIEPLFNMVYDLAKTDVDATCKALTISPDPNQWSVDEVKQWMLYKIRQYSLPMISLGFFNIDGLALSSLSEEEFKQRAPQIGDTLHAQLEIWKNLHQRSMSGNTDFSVDNSLLDICALLQWGNNSNTDKSSVAGDISDDDDEDSEKSSTSGRSGSSSSHIHLWQFLKELLSQAQAYGSCIRWLDRQKGVFKIEDSVRVARLWGKRKNRPAMNYDKLSRSIRQYYKKGIMKKTERSQRLVYQFCHPYCL